MTQASAVSEYLATIGARGGKATARTLTPEQRSRSARKAARARWRKPKRRKR